MKDKEDDQHEEYVPSADTKAFLKLVDAMFITGRRGDAEISDTFEFHFEESDNDEIRIFEKITFPLLDEAERMPLYYCIVIKKAWISRIITTLRTLPFEDYDINFPEGIWNRHIVHEYEECQVNLEFLPSAKDYATLQIMPIWKEPKEKTTLFIEIPYLPWDKSRLMAEFIEPVLVELAQFLTEEERTQLPPPWRENKKQNIIFADKESGSLNFFKAMTGITQYGLAEKEYLISKGGNVHFEFYFEEKADNEELNDDELEINAKRTDSFGRGQWESIIIKKAWIPLIITTLRNTTIDDYNTPQTLVYEYGYCNLSFIINVVPFDYSYIKIYPVWKNENKSSWNIEIPYVSRKETKLMSEFIEPFLVALSQFLTEEERGKLSPPWSVNEKKELCQRPWGDLPFWFGVWLEGKDWYAGETDKSDDESIVAKIEKITKYQSKKTLNADFEYSFEELDNDELRINGKRTGTFGGGQQKSIVIQKNRIPWMISTLRNLSVDNYQTRVESIINKWGTCQLTLSICLIGDGYSYIKIFPMWKDEKKISPALEIPFFPWHAKNEQSHTLTSKWRYTRFEFNFEESDNNLKIMSEFIEPFLVALSQFLPEEERKKLPTPWSPKGELRINTRTGSRFGTGSWQSWDSVVIKKEWILWIITTLRNLTYRDYCLGEQDYIECEYEDCTLIISLYIFEKGGSFIKIGRLWKDEKRRTSAIEIPYDHSAGNKAKLMSEFIEPFLVELSQFLTEEEREKLPPRVRMMRDKVKPQEYFDERFKKDSQKLKEILQTYHHNIETDEHQAESDIRAFKYQIYTYAFYKFYTGYSLGLDMHELLPEVDLILRHLIDAQDGTDNYEDMETILYFIMLFNRTEFLDDYRKLLQKSEQRDFYLDYLMVTVDPTWQLHTQKLRCPKHTQPLYEVVMLSKENKAEAVQRLRRYLKRQWILTLRKGVITHHDLKDDNYRGFWCITSAALVKALKLDDTELKDCKYYPCDMAHFC